jgi:hypothetical protein
MTTTLSHRLPPLPAARHSLGQAFPPAGLPDFPVLCFPPRSILLPPPPPPLGRCISSTGPGFRTLCEFGVVRWPAVASSGFARQVRKNLQPALTKLLHVPPTGRKRIGSRLEVFGPADRRSRFEFKTVTNGPTANLGSSPISCAAAGVTPRLLWFYLYTATSVWCPDPNLIHVSQELNCFGV